MGKKKLSRRDVIKPSRPTTPANGAVDYSESDVTSTYPRIVTHYLLPLVLWLGICVIYCRTSYPTISGGDSGELICNAHTFGVAHPPGYPLWTILGHIFDRYLLSFTSLSVATRIAMLSVVTDAAAACFIYLAILTWTGNPWTGVFSATLFAFSPQVWTYATQAEVFGLNNLFIGALLWMVVCYFSAHERGDYETARKWARIGAFVSGLALSNQHTSVVFELPLVFTILYTGRAYLVYEQREFVRLAMLFFSGLLPYVQLFVAARHPKPFAWGNTRTLSGFLHHFLRREYGTLQLYSGEDRSGGLLPRIALYFSTLHKETLGLAIPLAAVGAWVALSVHPERRRKAVAFLLAFLLYIVGFFSLTNLPIEKPLHRDIFLRFFPQPNALVLVWAGVGADWLWKRAFGSLRRHHMALAALAVGVAVAQGAVHYHMMDNSHNWLTYHYGHALLDPLPDNALLLVKGDLVTNSVMYLQICEGVRPDVRLASMSTMTYEWFHEQQKRFLPGVVFPNQVYHPFRYNGYSMAQFLDANWNRFPDRIFEAGEWKEGDNSITPVFQTIPHGMSYRVLRRNETRPMAVWHQEENAALPPPERFGVGPRADPAIASLNGTWPSLKYHPGTWEYVVLYDYWHSQHDKALYLLRSYMTKRDAGEPDADPEWLKECIAVYEMVLESYMGGEDNVPEWNWLNLGLCYERLRLHLVSTNEISVDDSLALQKKVAKVWSKWLTLAPHTDNNYAPVKKHVQALMDFFKQMKIQQ